MKASLKENELSFDHDFDHFRNKVSNTPMSPKCYLERPKLGNELYWDAKISVKALLEFWGSRGREFKSRHSDQYRNRMIKPKMVISCGFSLF